MTNHQTCITCNKKLVKDDSHHCWHNHCQTERGQRCGDCAELHEHQSEMCSYLYQAHCKPERCWITRKEIQRAKEMLKFWGWWSYDKNDEIPLVIP